MLGDIQPSGKRAIHTELYKFSDAGKFIHQFVELTKIQKTVIFPLRQFSKKVRPKSL